MRAGALDSEVNGLGPVPALLLAAGRRLDREYVMIIILALVVLIAAVVVGVAAVLGNRGIDHALVHPFSVLGYHVACSGPAWGSPGAGAATPAAACGSPARRRPMSAGIATTSSTSARPPAPTRQAPRTTTRPAAIPVRAQTTAAGAGCTCSGDGQLPRRPPPKHRNRRMARLSRMPPPKPRPRSSTGERQQRGGRTCRSGSRSESRSTAAT